MAGGYDLHVSAEAPGHDPDENCSVPQLDGGEVCQETYEVTCHLCKWNTVVGTVNIGGKAAEGYTVELVDMSVDPPSVEDSDTTTADGVFSLEGLSEAHETYRINLYNTSGTFISTTGDFDVSGKCGATGVFTYTDGSWSGPTWPTS